MSIKDSVLYWLPHCTTCRKAVKFLEHQGVEIKYFHNLKTEKISRQEVEELADLVGGTERLFSRRATKYRELKLNERELSEAEMIELMANEYTFITRPVLVLNGKAVAGFSEKNYEKFLKTNE